MFEHLEVETCDNVCTITMNRSQVLNALNQQMWGDLVAVFRWLRNQPEIRVAILTGKGRGFCVGADLKETAWKGETPSQSRRRIEANQQQLAREMIGAPMPIIAAINGYAMGGGVEISLGADFRLASETAVMGFPETSLGLFITGAASRLLPVLVGMSQAKRLIYTGERIDAVTAQALGLVDEAVPAVELSQRVMALARQIAENAPMSVASAKSVINRVNLGDIETALAMETDVLINMYATEDNKEGSKAFAERRKPIFTGS